jgi:hypothetical protein
MRDSMQATKVFVSADKHSFSERDATRLLLTASNRSSLRLTPLRYAFFQERRVQHRTLHLLGVAFDLADHVTWSPSLRRVQSCIAKLDRVVY